MYVCRCIRFPDATDEELRAVADDVCVICLKQMHTAKKLRCGHLFHRFCLRQCLQKASVGDTFSRARDAPAVAASLARASQALRCPICRKSIQVEQQEPAMEPLGSGELAAATAAAANVAVLPNADAAVVVDRAAVVVEGEEMIADVIRFSSTFSGLGGAPLWTNE